MKPTFKLSVMLATCLLACLCVCQPAFSKFCQDGSGCCQSDGDCPSDVSCKLGICAGTAPPAVYCDTDQECPEDLICVGPLLTCQGGLRDGDICYSGSIGYCSDSLWHGVTKMCHEDTDCTNGSYDYCLTIGLCADTGSLGCPIRDVGYCYELFMETGEIRSCINDGQCMDIPSDYCDFEIGGGAGSLPIRCCVREP